MSKIECYGQYKTAKAACRSCDHAGYCKDARDPSPLKGSSFDDVKWSESVSVCHPSDEIPKSAGPSALLSELLWGLRERPGEVGNLVTLLYKLVRIHRVSPCQFQIALLKITRPGLSYSDIAAKCNVTKQNVGFHIQRLKKLIPEASAAILIDHRHHPEKYRNHKALTRGRKSLTRNGKNVILGKHIQEHFGNVTLFAKRANMPQNTIQTIIAGTRKPRHGTRCKLATALGMSVEELGEQFGV